MFSVDSTGAFDKGSAPFRSPEEGQVSVKTPERIDAPSSVRATSGDGSATRVPSRFPAFQFIHVQGVVVLDNTCAAAAHTRVQA